MVKVFFDRLRIGPTDPGRRSSSCPGATSRRCCSPGCSASTPGAAARRADPRDRRRREGRGAGLIAELAEKGLAVVLISSELEEVVEGSDSVVVLRDGAQLGSLFGDEITEDAIMDMIAEAADSEVAVDGQQAPEPEAAR